MPKIEAFSNIMIHFFFAEGGGRCNHLVYSAWSLMELYIYIIAKVLNLYDFQRRDFCNLDICWRERETYVPINLVKPLLKSQLCPFSKLYCFCSAGERKMQHGAVYFRTRILCCAQHCAVYNTEFISFILWKGRLKL